MKNSNLKADLEISRLKQKICELQSTIKILKENIGPKTLHQLTTKPCAFTSSLVTSVKLSEQGECRVLAHSNHLSLLVNDNYNVFVTKMFVHSLFDYMNLLISISVSHTIVNESHSISRFRHTKDQHLRHETTNLCKVA